VYSEDIYRYIYKNGPWDYPDINLSKRGKTALAEKTDM